MAKIQEVFNRIQEIKQKQKEIKSVYKDALDGSLEYQNIVSELKELREKKKHVEHAIKSDFSKELDKLDRIKTDLESENILLSDIALNHIVKGEPIELEDEYQNKYEPQFSVKFKKI